MCHAFPISPILHGHFFAMFCHSDRQMEQRVKSRLISRLAGIRRRVRGEITSSTCSFRKQRSSFRSATPPLGPSCARRKPASWQPGQPAEQEGKQIEGGTMGCLVRARSVLQGQGCNMVLWPELCRRKARCKNTQASWKLAVPECKPHESRKLVSSGFRKWRLAVWPACSGPVPSFRARVLCQCDNASKVEAGSAGSWQSRKASK